MEPVLTLSLIGALLLFIVAWAAATWAFRRRSRSTAPHVLFLRSDQRGRDLVEELEGVALPILGPRVADSTGPDAAAMAAAAKAKKVVVVIPDDDRDRATMKLLTAVLVRSFPGIQVAFWSRDGDASLEVIRLGTHRSWVRSIDNLSDLKVWLNPADGL